MENSINSFLQNNWVTVAIALFLILYGINLSKIELPGYIKNLFNNTMFKILFLSMLLIFRFDNAPHVAILIAMIFVLSIDNLTSMESRENFDYLETYVDELNH